MYKYAESIGEKRNYLAHFKFQGSLLNSFNILRIPVPIQLPNQSNMKYMIPKGFSVNFLMLLWSVFGGFLLHAYLANFRVMLLTPVYEKAMDTAQDLVDAGMIAFVSPGSEYLLHHLRDSPVSSYQELYKNSVVFDDYDSFNEAIEDDVFGANTHVMLSAGSWDFDALDLGPSHGSKELLEGASPYGYFLSNKRFPLNEECELHLIKFQQVCSTAASGSL